MLSCEICKIFKNTYLEEHLRTTASVCSENLGKILVRNNYENPTLAGNNFTDKNSRPEVFCKEGLLRNFTKFAGKQLCQSLVFNKVAGLGLQLY